MADLTWIDVVDTSVKIGFGAIITAISGYLVLRKTQTHEIQQYNREKFQKLQEEKKLKYVEFLAQSQELIQSHLYIDGLGDSEEYKKYLRAFNEVQIISNDQIRLEAYKVMQEVSTFVFLNKELDTDLQDKIIKIAREKVSLFQKVAQDEVCKPYEQLKT